MRELLDWEFREFLTPKLVRLAYIFAVAFGAIATIVADMFVILRLDHTASLPWQSPRGTDNVFFVLVCLSPVIYLAGVVLVRVALEAVIVFFTMAEALTQQPSSPAHHDQVAPGGHHGGVR